MNATDPSGKHCIGYCAKKKTFLKDSFLTPAEEPYYQPLPHIPNIDTIIWMATAKTLIFLASEETGLKEGEKFGETTVTEDDEAGEIFDPDAGPNEQPINEEEADAIRDAVRGDEGRVEIPAEEIGDPKHQGEDKISLELDKPSVRIHLYEDRTTHVRTHGKIKRRY